MATSPPEVILGIDPKPRFVTIHEAPDDVQLTLLAAQKVYEGHDCPIRSAPRMLITEVLVIDSC
jgi:hypothetical protein